MNCHLRGMDALDHPQQKPNLSVLKNWTVHLKRRKKNVTVTGIKPTRNNFSPEKFRPLSCRRRGRDEKTRGKFEISKHWRFFRLENGLFGPELICGFMSNFRNRKRNEDGPDRRRVRQHRQPHPDRPWQREEQLPEAGPARSGSIPSSFRSYLSSKPNFK